MPDSTSQARRCGDLAGQPHRPGQVGDHLVERGGRAPGRAAPPGTRRGRSPGTAPAARRARPGPGPARPAPAPGPPRRSLRPSAAPSSAPCSAPSRSVVACDSSPTSRRRSTSRARVSRRRDSRSSRGQLVGLAHPLVQLGAPLHAAQQEPGAVGHVLHEPLVGRGDRAVRLARSPARPAAPCRRAPARRGRCRAGRAAPRGCPRRPPAGRPAGSAAVSTSRSSTASHTTARCAPVPSASTCASPGSASSSEPAPTRAVVCGQHRVRRGEPVVGEPRGRAGRSARGPRPSRPPPPPRPRTAAAAAGPSPTHAVERRPPRTSEHRAGPARDQQQPQQASRRAGASSAAPSSRHSPSRCERR